MSKESYIRGFCKTAEAAGVDPQALAKFAQQTFPGIAPGPNKVNAVAQDIKDLIEKMPVTQQAALAGSGFAQNMALGNLRTFKPKPKADFRKLLSGGLKPNIAQKLPQY